MQWKTVQRNFALDTVKCLKDVTDMHPIIAQTLHVIQLKYYSIKLYNMKVVYMFK